MRITIDVDEEVLKQAMELTGENKKGPAITRATSEFVRGAMLRKFTALAMAGEFGDYPMTNEQLEDFDR